MLQKQRIKETSKNQGAKPNNNNTLVKPKARIQEANKAKAGTHKTKAAAG
jgi:hypothetical protein